LEESNGDVKKAKAWLAKKGLSKAAKKADRETSAGAVTAYIHAGGEIGALIKIGCETDFVAQNEEFGKLAKEIGMQIVSMNPKDVKDLMSQNYIRDPKKTIEDLVKEAIVKLGENIKIVEFVKMSV
jgi:elongation factor Ts